jgi:hypothetical protein
MRQGARRHHIRAHRRHRFDPANHDFRLLLQGHTPPGLAQERGFPGIGFDQHHVELGPQRCQNQPGKSSAGAEIGQSFCVRGNERQELRRVEDMAAPDIVDRRRPDQVDGLLPLEEQFDIRFQLPPCFT